MATSNAGVTPRSKDPVPELLGWTAHNMLAKRFKTYTFFSILEVGVSIVSLVLMLTQISSKDRATKEPLVVMFWITFGFSIVRSIALACVARAYGKVKAADLNTIIRDMDRIPSREFWERAEMAWLLSTMLLIMWYGFFFLLLSASHFTRADGTLANILAGISIGMGIFHFLLWKDALENVEDPEDHPYDGRMRELCDMYKTKQIELQPFEEAVKGNENAPTMCCVCLEDFSDKDEVVQLPCGHVFHPLCSHIWISQHWNCPLRCDIGIAPKQAKQAVPQVAPADEDAIYAAQADARRRPSQQVEHAAPALTDIEAGVVPELDASSQQIEDAAQRADSRHLLVADLLPPRAAAAAVDESDHASVILPGVVPSTDDSETSRPAPSAEAVRPDDVELDLEAGHSDNA